MIYQGNDISSRAINKLLGKPITFNIFKPEVTGSPGLYLKEFTSVHNSNDQLKIDSKCNFEKRPKGLLLRTNYSNILSVIAMHVNSISTITLTKGIEVVEPRKYSPLWILLELGIPLNIARYVANGHEYSIEQLELVITSQEYEFKFIASGYLFERHLNFFTSLNYDDILSIKLNKNH